MAIMNKTIMSVLALLSMLSLAAFSAARASEGRDEVGRIESAFIVGLGRAATPRETFECLRYRNAELARVLERTYAATLAWLSGRQEMIDALERDQARWRSDVEAVERIWGASIEDAIASQATISTMLLERLRLFSSITAAAAFQEEAAG